MDIALRQLIIWTLGLVAEAGTTPGGACKLTALRVVVRTSGLGWFAAREAVEALVAEGYVVRERATVRLTHDGARYLAGLRDFQVDEAGYHFSDWGDSRRFRQRQASSRPPDRPGPSGRLLEAPPAPRGRAGFCAF